MKLACCLSIVILAAKASIVNGHGYAWLPYSRNSFSAFEGEGKWVDTDETVLKFYNPENLQNGGDAFGACGQSKGGNPKSFTSRSDILTPNGNEFPFTAQAHYVEGGVIEIRSIITAHHMGHIIMFASTNVDNPTEASFLENPLEYVDDPLYGAPQHPDYPSRAYLAPPSKKGDVDPSFQGDLSMPPSNRGNDMLFIHRFRLPEGIHGDEVLLLWFYVTNQGCRSPGDFDYPFPDDSWIPPGGNNICDYMENGYPQCQKEDRDLYDCRDPQIFRNCIEVSIEASGTAAPTTSIMPSSQPSLRHSSQPSVSRVPTNPPEPSTKPSLRPSSQPSVSQTPTGTKSANGCCSFDLKTCNNPTDWCNTFERCETNCNRFWLPEGERSGCVAYNQVGCDINADDCCEGATCTLEGNKGACRIP